jgi:hypothetical protein
LKTIKWEGSFGKRYNRSIMIDFQSVKITSSIDFLLLQGIRGRFRIIDPALGKQEGNGHFAKNVSSAFWPYQRRRSWSSGGPAVAKAAL